MGIANKQARLADLQQAWVEPLRKLKEFRVYTPFAAGQFGAIGLFNLEGVPGQQLCAYLFREHRLYTTVQLLGELEAVRVVVGLPSPLSHVERLLEAVASAAIHFNKSGTRSF